MSLKKIWGVAVSLGLASAITSYLKGYPPYVTFLFFINVTLVVIGVIAFTKYIITFGEIKYGKQAYELFGLSWTPALLNPYSRNPKFDVKFPECKKCFYRPDWDEYVGGCIAKCMNLNCPEKFKEIQCSGSREQVRERAKNILMGMNKEGKLQW